MIVLRRLTFYGASAGGGKWLVTLLEARDENFLWPPNEEHEKSSAGTQQTHTCDGRKLM